MNPKVDAYVARQGRWQTEVKLLRKITLSLKLREELKWGHPCYSLDGSNVVLIHCFKEYCALLFFKGALLKDGEGILIQQTKNVQAARQLRFKHASEIMEAKSIIKTYIAEAIDLEKSGVKVNLKNTSQFAMPKELKDSLASVPGLNDAFKALTPGRQRAYMLFIGGAKQLSTRQARVDKNIARILGGKGLDD